ncbi:DUF4817 domain-containing protein [Trichonephila clavata]|uniref:DUF4817 domain-containing protein n=1 Tax=Trichonephila clavata TaxID=2740835 RepID=A0A8X6L0I9_TRICU|nr:DUF4817 domain-containing protein [Trichonephila clavata]
MYGGCNGNALRTAREYARRYPSHRPSDVNVIRRLDDRLQNTGSVWPTANPHDTGIPRSGLTVAQAGATLHRVEEKPDIWAPKLKKNRDCKDKDEGIITSLLHFFPGAAGTDEYLKMEATLSAFENCLQTADAKCLKGSSPMLMEFLTPIFHIFSDLIVKMTPSSSISPTGPPSEDRSVYEQIRDLERQVALSEGKLQESQRCFDSVISSLASNIESTVSCVNDLKSTMKHNTDTLASLPATIAKPSYAQVASLPANVSNFTIAPPPSEKVLLVRPLESNADSSTTRNKITSFPLNKNLPFRITRIKNINNGGIAICLTTDEDVNKLSQELSKNADFANFSVSKPTLHKPQFVLFGVNSSYNKYSITKALLLKNDILKDGGLEVNFSMKSKSSNNWVISVSPYLSTPLSKIMATCI